MRTALLLLAALLALAGTAHAACATAGAGCDKCQTDPLVCEECTNPLTHTLINGACVPNDACKAADGA